MSRSKETEIGGRCQRVGKGKIAADGEYNLAGQRYRENERGQSIWPMVALSEVCEMFSGGTPARGKASYYEAGKIPWLRSGEVSQGEIFHSELFITEKGLKNSSAKMFCPNTVLVAMYGATAGEVGILRFSACTNQAICGIMPDNRLSSDFLYFVLKAKKQSLIRLASGGAQQNISQKIIRKFKIPLPPLEEQRAIAITLAHVHSAVQAQDKIIKVTQDLKRAAMRELFTCGLRGEPQKETEIGPVPESWKSLPIAELGDIITGTTPSTKERMNYDGGDIPFITAGDIEHGSTIGSTEKHITSVGLMSARSIGNNVTCFVCIGSIGKVGYTATTPCATNQQINSIIPKEDFDPQYVFYLMTYWADHIRRQASASPVPILSKGAFEQIVIFSSLDQEEQQEIAAILDAIDRKIDLHRRKRAVLDDLFKALLHKLMTGEIQVCDLNLSTLMEN